jgi:hypothetical protein
MYCPNRRDMLDALIQLVMSIWWLMVTFAILISIIYSDTDAYENARFLCERYYLTSPSLKLEMHNAADPTNSKITIVAVPSHLYHIMFELFKVCDHVLHIVYSRVFLDFDSEICKFVHIFASTI